MQANTELHCTIILKLRKQEELEWRKKSDKDFEPQLGLNWGFGWMIKKLGLCRAKLRANLNVSVWVVFV